MRRRLVYLGRLLKSSRNQLVALLWSRGASGQPLPWVKLIITDLRWLWTSSSRLRAKLGDPILHAMDWYCFIIQSCDVFNNEVRDLHFTQSICDKTEVTNGVGAGLTFICFECQDVDVRPAFATQKALDQNRRTKHNLRNTVRFYANPDGVCPSCKSVFSNRQRLIAHVSDWRRQSCRDLLSTASVQRLPDSTVQQLDNDDRASLRAARKDGHTHVLSSSTALRANGRRMGRAV